MIECVPNFSEGRDRAKVAAIAAAMAAVPGVFILGWEADADHNRSVITVAGEAEPVLEAAILAVGKAAQLIDLRTHLGVHPRVGATDVLPFVPLEGNTLADCVSLAHRAGAEIWRRFNVPAYFYEAAARFPERRPLQNTRRAGFDGRPPDIGNTPEHSSAGATMVGARDFLIAYNINLATTDVALAKQIARSIRESSGGFASVKAMGLFLRQLNCAQVSMNLIHFAKIPLDELYATVEGEAKRLGTSIAGSELIGFIPLAAYHQSPAFFDRIKDFNQSRIIENRVATLR